MNFFINFSFSRYVCSLFWFFLIWKAWKWFYCSTLDAPLASILLNIACCIFFSSSFILSFQTQVELADAPIVCCLRHPPCVPCFHGGRRKIQRICELYIFVCERCQSFVASSLTYHGESVDHKIDNSCQNKIGDILKSFFTGQERGQEVVDPKDIDEKIAHALHRSLYILYYTK